MEFLASIPMGCVIVEGTYGQCLASINPRGTRSLVALRNEFIGSLISWTSEYQLPFWFLDTRRLAERMAWKILKRGHARCNEQHRPVSPAADVIADLC
jgi:hypothetical protein